METGNWAQWPLCPRCQSKRTARCSACSASGTDFRLADAEQFDDSEEAESDTDVLLLCSTCDEPVTPQFYRRCVECGFDFGGGIDQADVAREELNNRVVLVMIGMVLLLGGLLAFFALVLRG